MRVERKSKKQTNKTDLKTNIGDVKLQFSTCQLFSLFLKLNNKWEIPTSWEAKKNYGFPCPRNSDHECLAKLDLDGCGCHIQEREIIQGSRIWLTDLRLFNTFNLKAIIQ